MAAQADSAPPAGGAELNWLWRIALVGGLTLIVVLVWALRENSPDPVAPAPIAPPASVESAQPSAPAAAPAAQPPTAEPPAAPAPQPAAQPAPVEWPAQSGIVPGRPDPPAPLRPAAFERYLVQRGETLILIAALRGVDLQHLLLFNPELGDGSILPAGAEIWIPIWEADDDDAP